MAARREVRGLRMYITAEAHRGCHQIAPPLLEGPGERRVRSVEKGIGVPVGRIFRCVNCTLGCASDSSRGRRATIVNLGLPAFTTVAAPAAITARA